MGLLLTMFFSACVLGQRRDCKWKGLEEGEKAKQKEKDREEMKDKGREM